MDPEGTLMCNTNVGHAGEAEWRKGQESSEVQNYRDAPFSKGTVLCALLPETFISTSGIFCLFSDDTEGFLHTA